MLAFVTCPDETKDDDLTAPRMEQDERSQSDRSGAALIAAMQASPFREVDLTQPSVRAPVSAISPDDGVSKRWHKVILYVTLCRGGSHAEC